MKALCYETIFCVTETCNNGNERRIKKSVLFPRFRNGIHVTEQERISAGTDILKAEHYYNIEYLETKNKTILYAE